MNLGATMMNTLLLLLAVTISSFSLNSFSIPLESSNSDTKSSLLSIRIPLLEVKDMLHTQAPSLREAVIDKVLATLKCAQTNNVIHDHILTVIDYSLPSNQKRLWVFDLDQKKLLFYTYVSHGIKSGALLTNYFSNKHDSKASSIGVYRTEKAYYGREGLSLRLEGLDKNFNDNAFNRSIVMHGGWYVNEHFIKRYGRPGRSWGCPALPLALYQPIINTIKNESLFVAYYPNEDWFATSKFLNCGMINTAQNNSSPKPFISDNEQREEVLLASVRREKEEPIIAMSADNYEQIFHAQAPLTRMLRRQINNAEYVALSNAEFNRLAAQNKKEHFTAISFVIPTIHMVRGYYETQMKIVNLGTIKNIRSQGDTSKSRSSSNSYTVNFENQTAIYLKTTNRFIRWVGL
jgi:hypothetical protein